MQHGTIGHGIKKLKEPNRGRLLLAFNHRTADTTNAITSRIGNDLLYRDPHGTWTHADGVQPSLAQEIDATRANDVGPGESRVAERADGSLVLIARKRWNSATYTRARAIGTSTARGADWSAWSDAPGLVGCNFADGGFLRFSDTCHLYSFPNNPGSSTRRNLSVAASGDGGLTWGPPKTIYAGEANYSDLARDSRGNIYCVFGRDGGSHNIDADPSKPKARVTVARFNLEWLTGVDTPTIVLDDAAGRFAPDIVVAGNYEILVRLAATPNSSVLDAFVDVSFDGGKSIARVAVDRNFGAGNWYYVGTFNLATGSGNRVTLSPRLADAVMFQKQ